MADSLANSSNNDQPLISIIVATYNASETLQACINSVMTQTYQHKELIIIDGGSTDSTLSIIKSNQQYISEWLSEKDTGVYSAWNKGLKLIKGDWVYFLGADDVLLDLKVLEKAATLLSNIDNRINIAYGQVVLYNSVDQTRLTVGELWGEAKKHFASLMTIPHQGVMHRRRLFDMHGEFDESFRIAGDYELLLRELKNNDAVFLPKIIFAEMRLGGISNIASNSIKSMLEVRLAQRKHGYMLPSAIWVLTFAKIWLRLKMTRYIGESYTKRLITWVKSIF